MSSIKDSQQYTNNSSPVLLSATLIPFSLITVLSSTVSVILGVIVYRLKLSMKSTVNKTALDPEHVEMENISEYASVSIDVKPTSKTNLQVHII